MKAIQRAVRRPDGRGIDDSPFGTIFLKVAFTPANSGRTAGDAIEAATAQEL